MAGSLVGGRVSTFNYGEITGIEYNSGMINGVLEILTASYEGTKNKDYWRGVTKSRNADSNDPWTPSNCLPLDRVTYGQAQSYLNEMQQMITEAKKPTVIVNTPQSNSSIAGELKELVALLQSGILSDEEFAAAKAKLLKG